MPTKAGDEDTTPILVFQIIAAVLFGILVLWFVSTYIAPMAGESDAAINMTLVDANLQKLCLYEQASNGQAETILKDANLVKLKNKDSVTPRFVAEKIADCFSARPVLSTGAPWDGKAVLDTVPSCPFNTENEGLNGHIICQISLGCEKFERGHDYKINIISTMAIRSVPLSDYCIIFSDIDSEAA